MNIANDQLGLLAFYLPQFHPTPENDKQWGKGFTEWHNVTKAKPLYPGHYQPRLPTELGFYDLRLNETRIAQAELAVAFGVTGFVYYHYWFNGKRLLHQPIDLLLTNREPSFPFCLCWANENWTRSWDGRDREVIQMQRYSHTDDLDHINYLISVMRDDRYIRIDGKPLLAIYRVEDLPEPNGTVSLWRHRARQAGLGDLYLVMIDNRRSGNSRDPNYSAERFGFDASVTFQPNFDQLAEHTSPYTRIRRRLARLTRNTQPEHNHFFRYSDLVDIAIKNLPVKEREYPCIITDWDNSSRRKGGATIFLGASPQLYERWLTETIRSYRIANTEHPKLIFVNAWNEWAEGTHLEPCIRWGRQYLEATRNAMSSWR